jgi:hypothetical protein
MLLCFSRPASVKMIPMRAAPDGPSATSRPPLTLQQVVEKLEEKNAERASALREYSATRDYSMQYSGFAGDHMANMVVQMLYTAPASKTFTIVSQMGFRFIIEHVFKRLIEAEREATANPEIRRGMELTTENYDFSMAGYEHSPAGGRYVLNLTPRKKGRYLYRGKIWVDDKDFAVVQMKGEPAADPSFWIRETNVDLIYEKVGDFWLPAENHTESEMRLSGVAQLSIKYNDYRILKAKELVSVAPLAGK